MRNQPINPQAIPNPRLRSYFARLELHLRGLGADEKNQLPFFTMAPEHRMMREKWLRYFDSYVGTRPIALRMLLANGARAFMVPTEEPTWFDPSYVDDAA